MAFDDFKDRSKEQFLAITARVQETAAWNQLAERFLDLTPQMQRAALWLGGALLTIIILLIPYSFFSSSQDELTAFEEKKQLLRELYQVSHAVSQLPPAPPPMSGSELRGAVQSVLGSEKPVVLPEQQISISEFDNEKAAGASLPKGLEQKGLMVNLSRLNVDQIVKLGSRFQFLRPTAKITSLKIQATAADPHFFDVTFRLVGFGLPQPIQKPSGTAKPGFGRGNAKPPPSGGEG